MLPSCIAWFLSCFPVLFFFSSLHPPLFSLLSSDLHNWNPDPHIFKMGATALFSFTPLHSQEKGLMSVKSYQRKHIK